MRERLVSFRRCNGAWAVAVSATAACALQGCSRSPSFNVLGSYFPGWIFCIAVSVLVTALLRLLLKRMRWEEKLPLLPLFYFTLALLIACMIWLICFE